MHDCTSYGACLLQLVIAFLTIATHITCMCVYIYTRCTYSQFMPRMHLNDLWTNTCGLLLVGVARTFGTVNYACATKCEKCKKEGKAYVERVARMWVQFRTTQNARIWLFLKTTTCFICFARCWCFLLYSLFLMRTSWHCGCISLSVFSSLFTPGS